MKKYVLVLLASVLTCYGQVSITTSMSNMIMSDLEKGRTDSLFIHIQTCYEMAGWKLNKPRPRLEKQDYLQPISMTNDERILQTELMSQKKQGYLYWQNWSNLITDSTWRVKEAFPKEKDAYLLGNYTIMLIMAHELGHYYSAANDLRGSDSEWENLADHFAIAFVNELAKTNTTFEVLKNKYLQLVTISLYEGVQLNNRTIIADGFSLYEYVYFFTLPDNMSQYVTLQLARERILLKDTELNLSNLKSKLNAGQNSVASTKKYKSYPKDYKITKFPSLNENNNLNRLSFYASKYQEIDIQMFKNGEFYVTEMNNDSLILHVLTPNYNRVGYYIGSIRPSIVSKLKFDPFDANNSIRSILTFKTLDSLNITIVQKLGGDYDTSAIKWIDFNIKSKEPNGHYGEYRFRSRSFTYDAYKKGIFRLLAYKNSQPYFVANTGENKYKWSNGTLSFIEVCYTPLHPIDDSCATFPFYSLDEQCVGFAESPSGNRLWLLEDGVLRFANDDNVYTLSALIYGNYWDGIFKTSIKVIGPYSDIYGFLLYDTVNNQALSLKI